VNNNALFAFLASVVDVVEEHSHWFSAVLPVDFE